MFFVLLYKFIFLPLSCDLIQQQYSLLSTIEMMDLTVSIDYPYNQKIKKRKSIILIIRFFKANSSKTLLVKMIKRQKDPSYRFIQYLQQQNNQVEIEQSMSQNSIISLQIHSYTFLASLTNGILRITLEVHHHQEIIYISPRFSQQQFPQQLQIIFQNVGGFYEYLYKIAVKNMVERISFKNGLLIIKVFIDDKMREIPIKMRRMREQKQNRSSSNQQIMLTSIASEPSQVSRVTVTSKQQNDYPAARLKLMMLKDNNKMKRGIMKADYSTISATQVIKQYPYTKPQTISRYDRKMVTENTVQQNRRSFTEGKSHFSRSKTLSLKKNMRQNNLDLSNKDLNYQNVKEIVTYDWSKLILLNIGYNNIGNQGFKLLTTIKWPILKTLYACFNNINKIEWIPANICFLKTLSLSGNKLKQIPKDIIELQFLEELFIYNNKIQMLPDQLMIMEQLKNFSIYGNKLDPQKNKKIIAKLKSRKVQVWQ